MYLRGKEGGTLQAAKTALALRYCSVFSPFPWPRVPMGIIGEL